MSYKVVIVEDEPPAAKRLSKMVLGVSPRVEIVEVLDSVESAVEFFCSGPRIDIVFMDIQLGDGLSFEIFSRVSVKAPVIFTTAYDEYTIQAFKVNSLDYLLKPIEMEELAGAINQFENYNHQQRDIKSMALEDLVKSIQHKKYKERFLIKKGKSLSIVYSDDIAFFHAEDGYSHITTSEGLKFIIDHTMDQLANVMDPATFYRISRKLIVNLASINSVHDYFNSRLKLKLTPEPKVEAIVARERVKKFKLWLDHET